MNLIERQHVPKFGVGAFGISALNPAQVLSNMNLDFGYIAYERFMTLVSGNCSQWNDLSGNANHAVQAAGAAQPPYDRGTLYGDGVDNRLVLTNNLTLGLNDYCAFAWVKQPAVAAAYQSLFASPSNRWYPFWFIVGTGVLSVAIGGTSFNSVIQVDDDMWHFIVVNADRSGNVDFFVDHMGNAAESIDISAEEADNIEALSIGIFARPAGGNPFKGYIKGACGIGIGKLLTEQERIQLKNLR